jgi:A/G-specific adenine glycosylase
MPATRFSDALIGWYRQAARRLPWRETRDPYAIWVSEIMLQQTRVEAVIPYYERFLEAFPTPEALAAAPGEKVLTLWAGLGYYSRARNLQKAAKLIAQNGRFPDSYDEIRALPGIGDYTAAAVASIAFSLPHAVLDGTVKRVMSRISNDFGDISSTDTRKRLQALADLHLDPKNPGDYNQGLMELGARICLPRDPKCLICPVAEFCEARSQGTQTQLPTKLRKQKMIAVEKELLLVEQNGSVLLRKRAPDELMPGFWDLPETRDLPAAELEEEMHSFRHSIMNKAYRCRVRRARIASPARPMQFLSLAEIEGVPLTTMARKGLRPLLSASSQAAQPAPKPKL